uniref:RNA polymerase sigma factor SigS n=1 Tax=Siphoviridae sp. ctwDi18 TaxID=2827970 RepID=A0A8S5T9D3_9CAUD|nr:MAG TPA: DNA directed RNA polymerase subunit [Siphoviridae sp. ctwDi18]
MTKEQEQLVTDNHNLIYHCIHKYKGTIEDYYDVCAIGLCKAAILYDTSKGVKFATYACVIIENEIRQLLRNNKKKYSVLMYSLDMTFNNTSDGTGEISYGENMTTGLSAYDEILPYQLDEVLNAQEYKVVVLTLQGYTQLEIGNIIGKSQAQISRYFHSIKQKLNEGGK